MALFKGNFKGIVKGNKIALQIYREALSKMSIGPISLLLRRFNSSKYDSIPVG